MHYETNLLSSLPENTCQPDSEMHWFTWDYFPRFKRKEMCLSFSQDHEQGQESNGKTFSKYRTGKIIQKRDAYGQSRPIVARLAEAKSQGWVLSSKDNNIHPARLQVPVMGSGPRQRLTLAQVFLEPRHSTNTDRTRSLQEHNVVARPPVHGDQMIR